MTDRPLRRALPTGVWVLGFGSLFMDASSELVHGLLPAFMTTVLGTSMLTLGAVEGIAEATGSITKIFSGALSDWLGRRKPLVVLGYGLSALTKPAFPLATGIGSVFAARFVDRIGKGIRDAPRDALVADITPEPLRGAAYGSRQALDSIGAFVGPLLAIILMARLANDIRSVLWAAVVPAAVAVTLLAVALREPVPTPGARQAHERVTWSAATALPLRYWLVVGVGSVFTLARFSEAFLVLRAQQTGLSIGYVPAVMIVMNVVYAAVSYPAGRAADRVSTRRMLATGLAVLVFADLVLASATTPTTVFAGTALWGLHMGLTQGLFSKLVADTTPPALRGTGFGVFNVAIGVALLLASMLAGALWSRFGPPATFLASAAFSTSAMIGLIAHTR
jgi:MFS family permease